MRLRLTLRPNRPRCSIPLSYNYYLSTAIYGWIEQLSPQYAAFLHDKGFAIEHTARKFKHFCFSNLVVPKREIKDGMLTVLSPYVHWYISMPVEESLHHLMVGIFEKQSFYIGRTDVRFRIEEVEIVPAPQYLRSMKFRLLSPLTISLPEERNGKILPHYLRPSDPRLEETLRSNMLQKYFSLFGADPPDGEFQVSLDAGFIAGRGGEEKIQKLITIKEGRDDESKVRGFMCPLVIQGNPDLIKLAYDSGLGEKGSMGFGMLQVL